MKPISERIRYARRAGTPVVGIETLDPAETIEEVRGLIRSLKKDNKPCCIQWDICRGMTTFEDDSFGAEAINAIIAACGQPREALVDPAVFLQALASWCSPPNNPEHRVLVFMHNATAYMQDPRVVQGIWNLRDVFKARVCMLILLATDFKDIPALLQSDTLIFDEELPGEDKLREIVRKQHEGAGVEAPKVEVLEKVIDAVRGLASFPAEQIVAMSLTAGNGSIDLDNLWERKRKVISQTQGLSIERGTENLSDIGGMAQIKLLGRLLFNGPRPPKVVVRVDEIEKMLGGAGASGLGDSSGVSQDALGVMLREMEDNGYSGLIAVGPPGSGKTLLSKVLGNIGGVPTITLDMGGMKGQFVGQSERAVRTAMKVIKGVAGSGGAFFLATCNKLDALPPELRRRFKLGTWFFDLPTAEEREDIWRINLAKYGLNADQTRPDDTDWTGAEIRNVCELARDLACPLGVSAEFIVPVASASPESVQALRNLAAGRFLSVSHRGKYVLPRTYGKEAKKGRALSLDD